MNINYGHRIFLSQSLWPLALENGFAEYRLQRDTDQKKPKAGDISHCRRCGRWIPEGREIHVGTTLDYRDNNRIGSYVRAEISGAGGLVQMNPFGFKRV